jgi:hypothetical protein
MLSEESLKPYLQLLPDTQPADLRIQQVGTNLELQDATGKALVAAFPPDKRHELPHDLKHIARYYNTLSLTNPLGELAGAIQVEFKKLAIEAGQVKAVELPRNVEGEVELVHGEKLVIKLTNTTADQPLYFICRRF